MKHPIFNSDHSDNCYCKNCEKESERYLKAINIYNEINTKYSEIHPIEFQIKTSKLSLEQEIFEKCNGDKDMCNIVYNLYEVMNKIFEEYADKYPFLKELSKQEQAVIICMLHEANKATY